MHDVTERNPAKVVESADGSIKYLWILADGQTVESVYLPLMKRGAKGPSMCVSSRVGCAVRCTFCATGQNGLMRNLTIEEIASQVHGMIYGIDGLPSAFDVSFMGMGEPLHNIHAVKAAIHALRETYARRCDIHFSLSTVGITRKLDELAYIGTPVSLQISLHGATDEVRRRLVPTKGCAPIAELLTAARNYADTRGEVVNINYMLFDGVNDTAECATRLADLIGDDRRFVLKVSHYNPIDGNDLNSASERRKARFLELCRDHGLQAFSWESMGVDISGGCGQLRSSPTLGQPWLSGADRTDRTHQPLAGRPLP